VALKLATEAIRLGKQGEATTAPSLISRLYTWLAWPFTRQAWLYTWLAWPSTWLSWLVTYS